MINALGLLKERRFLPLFTTQFLGAFNDNLFKQSMVLFATYEIFNDQRQESFFNTLTSGLVHSSRSSCSRHWPDRSPTAPTRRA